MRLLIVHNAYQHRGGEDDCVDNESRVLRDAGIDVQVHRIQNSPSLAHRMAAVGAPAGFAEEGQVEALCDEQKPDILHAHNLFPLLSPRLFHYAHQRGIKTVLTLHNFRPLCMNGLFMTPKGETCERCAPGNPGHGVWRRCYRSSIPQSLGMAAHLALASSRHWYDDVDLFIAPSQFVKDKYVAYGFPERKITVQGHFVAEWPADPVTPPEPHVLYLGRLSDEKGLRWLVNVFMNPSSRASLCIAGDGPLRAWVERFDHPRIRYLGYLNREGKSDTLRRSQALVLASRCYESFAMVVAEANSYGVPAIVPRRGAMAESVIGGTNGELYEPENPDSFWNAYHNIQQTFSSVASRDALKQWAQRFSVKPFLQNRVALYHGLCEPVASK